MFKNPELNQKLKEAEADWYSRKERQFDVKDQAFAPIKPGIIRIVYKSKNRKHSVIDTRTTSEMGKEIRELFDKYGVWGSVGGHNRVKKLKIRDASK
jgi:hypothetical protein